MASLYMKAKDRKRASGGTELSHFEVIFLSPHDQALYGWILLVLLKNIPLSPIEDPEMWTWFIPGNAIAKSTVTSATLHLVKLVQKRVTEAMSNTKGAVMFDGWSATMIHYIGVNDSSYKEYPNKQNERCLYLLSLAPMGKKDETGQLNRTSATFNAQSHVDFLSNILQYYDQVFDDWCFSL